jgi:hypothetical protein
MIEEIIEKIEDKIYGKKIFNLDISLSKICPRDSSEKLKKIAKYTGSFKVTEKGYLLGGSDRKLNHNYAEMNSIEIIPPTIVYQKGGADQIVHDFLGMRLSELKESYETSNKKCACNISKLAFG